MIIALDESYQARLQEIWESAVSHTHDFLSITDFEFYKSQLPIYFQVVQLYGYLDENNNLLGFLGTSDERVEMLFVDNAYRKTGVGRSLLNYAIHQLNIIELDVNEQNKQAVDFYLRMGFKVIDRFAEDGEGKPYPLLKMEYKYC